jgi:Cu(I)/Ag(I) efflux system membrane fusion protein
VRTLVFNAVIEDDDTRHRILAARVPGRIERLFVNYTGAEVAEGSPLAVVYSPAMLTAQREYVQRLRAGSIAYTSAERSAARERLLELGLTEEEVGILENTLQPTAMVNIRAPLSGTVVSRSVYEGQYVETNDRLFEIGDFARMWVVFDAYEPDLAWLRSGQEAEVTVASLPGVRLSAPVAFIDPNVRPDSRTARVRIVVDNPDRRLLHLQTARVTVRQPSAEVLQAPRTAVLRHRGHAVVFVETSARTYTARRIAVGRTGDDAVEVLSGLAEGERVVTRGGLLLDGQTELAHAAVAPTEAGHAHTHAEATPAVRPAHDEAGRTRLTALAVAGADAARALAADDLPAYQAAVPILRATLEAYLASTPAAQQGALARGAEALAQGGDLEAVRRVFEPFSTELADVVRAEGLHTAAGLRIFQCPMTPVLGTGRWLSRTDELRNPFFGSAMLECGEEVK